MLDPSIMDAYWWMYIILIFRIVSNLASDFKVDSWILLGSVGATDHPETGVQCSMYVENGRELNWRMFSFFVECFWMFWVQNSGETGNLITKSPGLVARWLINLLISPDASSPQGKAADGKAGPRTTDLNGSFKAGVLTLKYMNDV